VLFELLLDGKRCRGHRATLAGPSEAMPGSSDRAASAKR
jgi:hypothetical protein